MCDKQNRGRHYLLIAFLIGILSVLLFYYISIDNDTETTLALIKPDALDKKSMIQDIIIKNGFTILESKQLQLTELQTKEFYKEHDQNLSYLLNCKNKRFCVSVRCYYTIN